jgi:hypothetical protein
VAAMITTMMMTKKKLHKIFLSDLEQIFVVYFMTPAIFRNYRPMAPNGRKLLNNDLQRKWNEAVVSYSEY